MKGPCPLLPGLVDSTLCHDEADGSKKAALLGSDSPGGRGRPGGGPIGGRRGGLIAGNCGKPSLPDEACSGDFTGDFMGDCVGTLRGSLA
jgi:hypothetical protein